MHRIRDEEFDEFRSLFRCALGHQPAIDAAQRIGRLALAARHNGEVEPADLVIRQARFVRRQSALGVVERGDSQNHGTLAIAESPDGLRVFVAQKALLERLQIDQLLEVLARFLEDIAFKAAVFALHGRIKSGFATKPHRQMGPVEVQGPFIRATHHNRGDIGVFQLFDGTQQIIPCGTLAAVYARFGKQLLVIHEANLRDGVRQAVNLAVNREGFDSRSRELVLIGGDLRGDVFEHARFDLRLQHAARPAIDDMGAILGLQQCRGLGLVGLVFEELHLDLDARIFGLEIARHLFPDFDLIGVHLDMQPFERGIRPCRARKTGQSNRRAQ